MEGKSGNKLLRWVTNLAILVFNEQIGILTGKNHIAKTIDGGVNWFTTFESNELTFGKISFINDSVGWVSSNSNKIFHTTDQGLSWEEQSISTGNIISSVQFMNDSTGWIISYSNSPQGHSVLKTTDGGINWLEKIHLSQYKFTSMFLILKLAGLLVVAIIYIKQLMAVKIGIRLFKAFTVSAIQFSSMIHRLAGLFIPLVTFSRQRMEGMNGLKFLPD